MFQEASSAPLLCAPLPTPISYMGLPDHPISLDSSGLAPTSLPSFPMGIFPPGTSYIPSRVACSLLQLQRVPCILPQLLRPARSRKSLLATTAAEFLRGAPKVGPRRPAPAPFQPLVLGHVSCVSRLL